MTDARNRGRYSGEFMTGAGVRRSGAVIEGEFRVVAADEMQTLCPTPVLEPGGAARPSALRTVRARRPIPLGAWAAGSLLCAVAFWMSGGHVLLVPDRAAALPGPFSIASLTSRLEVLRGRPSLLVEAVAVNEGPAASALPAIAIEIADPEGFLRHYKLGTAGIEVAAGGRISFSGRIAAPKTGIRTVTAAFGG